MFRKIVYLILITASIIFCKQKVENVKNEPRKGCVQCLIDARLKMGLLTKYGKNLPDTTTMYYNINKNSLTERHPTINVTMSLGDTQLVSIVSDIDCGKKFIYQKPQIFIAIPDTGKYGLEHTQIYNLSESSVWEKVSNTSIYGQICRDIENER